MRDIEGPVTRAKVRELALEEAEDPSAVIEIVHDAFNADERSGGYAFVYGSGLVIYGFAGNSQYTLDPGDPVDRLAKVEEFWRRNQHRHRPLSLDDVSEWHRAAIAALVSGVGSVGDLPAEERLGVTDIAIADALLVQLRRSSRRPTEAAALRALAGNDWLLAVPRAGSGAHRCPLCGLPAIGRAWIDIISVCDDCYVQAVCADGRPVHGHNTDFGGGFQAVHLDDRSPCDQVTGEGRVWVNGQECRMGEAKFGGVYVGVFTQRT